MEPFLSSSSAVSDHPLMPPSRSSNLELSERGDKGAGGTQPVPPPPAAAATAVVVSSFSSESVPQQPFYPAAPPPPLPPNRVPPTFAPPPPTGPAITRQSPLLPLPPPPPSSYALSTSSASASAPSKTRGTSTTPKPETLDDWADAFFSSPPVDLIVERSGSSSYGEAANDEHTGGRRPPRLLLRPPPLEEGSGGGAADRLRALASRRAWGDVVALAHQLIQPGSTSHYAALYSNLLMSQHPRSPAPSSASSSSSSSHAPLSSDVLALDSQQDELGEILFYLVKGLLSMRRYTELRQQLDRWGFLFHNSVRGEGSFDRTGGGISVSGTSSSPSQRPSPAWIPWRLHVVAAAALLYNCSSPPQSLTTSSTDTNPSPSLDAADVLWRIRDAIPPDDISNRILAERVLSNVMIRTKQWRMAVGCLQRILDLIPSSLRDQGGQRRWRQQQQPLQAESIQLLEACYQVEVLSCQGRILLQMGALPEASRVFQHAQATWDDEAASSTKSSLSSAPTSEDWGSASALAVTVVQRSSAQLTVNQALLSFASCQYDRALELFRRAAAQIRQAEPLPGQNPASRRRRDAGGFDSSEDAFLLLGTDDPLSSLFSETCNNMALCAVYTCRLNEAIHLMESLVRQDPTRYLTDRVALNLCTLYELSSDAATSTRKKRVLQVIAKRFFLHDIGAECFRLGQ